MNNIIINILAPEGPVSLDLPLSVYFLLIHPTNDLNSILYSTY